MKKGSLKPTQILLVEDSSGDVRLIVEALKESRIPNNLYLASDGVEAMDFLRRKGKHLDAPRPDLVLLDLNLPKKNGIEVLTEIKNDADLKRIPVLILTLSRAEEDILKSYNMHANCYIMKPMDYEQFARVVKTIEDFWFTVAVLPSDYSRRRF